MSGQTWTPAPKKGLIPLHPLTFGMLLGRSFSALRHNPKVLFGFGVVVQLFVVVLSSVVMGFVFFTTFARLQSVSISSPDFESIFAGTIAMNLVAGIAVGLASVAFTAMMQGVVAAEVGYGAVGVKASLGTLWRRMAPSFWRLAGFSMLAVLAVFGVIAVVFAVIAGIIVAVGGNGTDQIGIIVAVVIILILAMIPLSVWLSTKLLLVPSVLVLERATLRGALVRSWRLTRGRFWVAWGVTILIGIIMGVATQVVSIPVSLFSGLLGGVIMPTGSSADPGAVFGFVLALLVPQILLLILQAITLVVQSTAGTLVYVDSRMRYEGLDQTLIAHVERRDLGWAEDQLGDPFVVDPARAVTDAPPPVQPPEWAVAQATYAASQGYPAQGYAAQYPVQSNPTAPYPGQGYPAPQQYAPAQPYPQTGAATPQPPAYAPQQPPAYAPQQPYAPQPPAYAPQPPAPTSQPPAYPTPAAPQPPTAPAQEAAPSDRAPETGWAAPGSDGAA